MAEETKPTPLWRNRDYMLLWSGQAISIVGTQVSQIAFPLLVLALTHSPAVAGFVAAARTVPWLLFALPAGALVDRWDRKLTMIVCSTGSAIALASVSIAYLLGTITISQIVLVSFIDGTFGVVFGLAQSAALPQVVPKAQLAKAVAQNNIQYAIGSIVGPPLGGVLYTTSPLLPFAIDASSYAASSISLTATRTRFQGTRSPTKRSLRSEIAEGIGWLWQQPLIRFMTFLTGTLNLGSAGYTLVVIVIAKQLSASAGAIGIVFAVNGIVGIAGAMIAPRIQQRFSFGQAIIGYCWGIPFLMGLLAIATTPLLLMAIVGLDGMFAGTYDTVQLSYRLALIPDALQGRVNSAFRLVAQGTRPLGLALTGILLQYVGGAMTALLLGGWLTLMAIVTTFNRQVRNAPPLDTVAAL